MVVDDGSPAEGASPPSPVESSSTPTPAVETSTSQSTPDSGDAGQSPQSVMDAVLKVVPATNEKDVLTAEDAAAPEATDKKPDDPDQADTESTDSEESAEDSEEPPPESAPAVRKKFNKLLKQRKELRAEVETMRPVAEIGEQLRGFAEQNNLSGEDIANTLKMAAMLRAGDYRSFYAAVAPFVRTAQEYLGVVLPSDLAARVKAGHMTEQAAREFARQRYDGQRAEFSRQETVVAAQRQQVSRTQDDVQRAVSNFELRLSASDPDYKVKAPAVRRAAQALIFERGGSISSVEEALDITKAAYDEVNKQMRSFQPRQATRPQPNGAMQSPSARPAPKSLYEAALQGLERSRQGS